MNRATRFTSTVVMAFTIFAALTAPHAAENRARGALGVALGPGSSLWLEGKSNVHDFVSKTGEMTVVLLGDSVSQNPADVAGLVGLVRSSGIDGVDVRVPVRSLKSSKSGIDKNLWKSLKADEHPTIRFHLAKYTPVSGGASADTIDVHAEGTLTIAGQDRPETLEAHLIRAADGLWLVGTKALNMSDFGIPPPKMMMGTMRVKDRIVVHYRLLLVPGGATDRAPARKN